MPAKKKGQRFPAALANASHQRFVGSLSFRRGEGRRSTAGQFVCGL
jgi:hypothetical protein